MENEVRFEDLSSAEQQKKLKEVMDQIKILQKADIANGSLEIADISFFRLADGSIAYDVAINNPDGTVGHLYYEESDGMIYQLDNSENEKDIKFLNGKIEEYSNSGMDLAPLKQDLETKEQFLASLSDSNKISLANLEIAESELTDLAIRLNLSLDEIEYFISIKGEESLALFNMSPEELAKLEENIEVLGLNDREILDNLEIDSQDEIAIDAKSFEQSGIHSESIIGNEKVTSNFTFNQIIGLNYESYKIVKTKGEPIVLGVTHEGTVEKIPEGRLEVNPSPSTSMSLIRDNGTIKKVGVLTSFRVKAPGSSIGRDQAIGLYSDNGYVSSFYARNAIGDRMLGEELPSRTHLPARVHNERLLDTKYNKDVEPEANSAENKTNDGCLTNNRNLGNGQTDYMPHQKDAKELAEEYADEYDLDADDIYDKFEDEIKDNHSQDKSDEEIIEEIAKDLSEEENDNHEPDDRDERPSPFEPKHF